MPRIVIRGIDKNHLKEVSTDLLTNIEKIIERPKSAFTLEAVKSQAFFDGEEISQIYVEVSWKSRPTEICKLVADSINKVLKEKGYNKIFVYFKDLDLEKEFSY